MPRIATRDEGKEAFWRRLIRDHSRSGLSIRAWCRRHGLQESAFYWWRAELARRDGAGGRGRSRRTGPSQTKSRRTKVSFVPVHVATASAASVCNPPSVSSRDDGRDEGRFDGRDKGRFEGRIEIVLPWGARVGVTGRVERQTLADVLALVAVASPVRQPDEARESRPC